MPSILFIHENFPAQFGGLAAHLAQQGWQVVFATAAAHVAHDGKDHFLLPGVHVVRYKPSRPASDKTHAYLTGTENAVLNAQAFLRLGAALSKGGFTPDVIVAHSGWGSGSLARVAWPNARFVQYLEWWYNIDPVDVLPNQIAQNREDQASRTLCRNLPFLLDAQSADVILVPTRFQAAQIPDILQPRVAVLHDGVDDQYFRPKRAKDAVFRHEGLPDDAPIVTYATRGMEPMRGFPQFMAAWADLQNKFPHVHCVIAGSDRICYGPKPNGAKSFKQRALAQHEYDMNRLHFTGLLPKLGYRALLQRSHSHVYLTRPFVLSWSLIEAMMTGAPVVASRTPPVQEAAPTKTVRYVDIEDPTDIALGISDTLSNRDLAKAHGRAARAHAQTHYGSKMLYAKRERLLSDLLKAKAA